MGSSTRLRRVATAAAIAIGSSLLPTGSLPSAAGAGEGPVDGRILFDSPTTGTPLMSTVDGTSTYKMPFGSISSDPSAAAFAPEGRRIAAGGANKLFVLDAGDSDPVLVTRFASDQGIVGLSWSPDGTEIVVVLVGQEASSERLVRVTLGPTVTKSTVAASGPDLTIEPYGGVSWGPGDRIAFVATQLSAEVGSGDTPGQLYTVSASGGPATRYNALPSTEAHRTFDEPTWSPSGATLAAYMYEDADGWAGPMETTGVVGTIDEGDEAVAPLADLPAPRACFAPDDCFFIQTGEPFLEWSVDGTHLAFAANPTPNEWPRPWTVRLVTVTTGEIVPVPKPPADAEGGPFPLDRQPCPSGTCADFRLALPSAPDVTAKPGPDGGRKTVTVRWTTPDRGAPFQRFYVEMVNVSTGARHVSWFEGNDRAEVLFFDSGRWKFRVRAQNARGKGTWSAYTTAVRPT